MPNRPLLRSRLVAALAKRTLLASSSASLGSSAVRSGARLNINGLVYHRRKALGLTSLPGASALLSAVPPGLVAVATLLHGTPPSRATLGVVVVRPTAVLGGADLHPRPTPLEAATTTSARIVPSAPFTPPSPLRLSGLEPSPKRTTSGNSSKIRPTTSDHSGPELAEAAERNASRSRTASRRSASLTTSSLPRSPRTTSHVLSLSGLLNPSLSSSGFPACSSARRVRPERGGRPQVNGRRRPALRADAVLSGRSWPHAARGRAALHPHDARFRRRLARCRKAHDQARYQTDSGLGICHVGGWVGAGGVANAPRRRPAGCAPRDGGRGLASGVLSTATELGNALGWAAVGAVIAAATATSGADALLGGLRWGLWSAIAYAALALVLVVVCMGRRLRETKRSSANA